MSLVLYQLAQRWVSAGTNAWSPLVVAYVLGALICGGGLLASSRAPITELRPVSGGSLLLGIAVVGIEFGYLQAHRAGWHLAAVGLVASTSATILLSIVAAIFLHEPLTVRQLFGMGFCVTGLTLLLHGV